MVVTINLSEKDIKKSEILEALNVFLTTVKDHRGQEVEAKCEPVEAPVPQIEAPVVPTAPVATIEETPAPAAPQVPVTNTAPAAPEYTLDVIAKAGTALIDAGKMGELTALLAKYGVETLTNLNPTYYNTFAADLRGLGAVI